MSTELQKKLREIAESIFEITCYMFAMDPEEIGEIHSEVDNNGDEFRAAKVTFHGAATGAMVISADEQLFVAIAANMLGVDETHENEKEAALREIANIICGNTVPLFAKNGKICYIDPPEIYSDASDLTKIYKDYNHCELTLYLDEGVSQISIFYKEG